jgi:glycosyltransferase involved in cell wall biosynthesis
LSLLLSIILPAYNEEQRLPESLRTIQAFLDQQTYSAEILVVENGSLDETARIASEFAFQDPRIRLHSESQAGKGLAVRKGMLEALGEYRFICDVDLSMPIEEVNRFLPPQLRDYDIAIASREAPGAVRYGEPAYRHWIGRAFNLIVRTTALPEFQDTQCGFKCFHRDAAMDLFSVQRIDGWTFDVEVLYIALRRGYQVVEVPIPWYYNPGSRVRLMRDSIAMFSDLFRIRRNWQRGSYHPRSDKP